MPSLGASNILATAQTMKPRNSAIPMRKRLLACAWRADSGCGADTFCSFTGMRRTGSRLTLAPANEPMAVAMAKNHACSENCGIPVKNAARLQPMARRAPKPAMMPPASAWNTRMRCVGWRSLTLLAHSAAEKQPTNMPMIITPSMRVSGVPCRPMILK
ncbi:hypothetical protein D3C71_1411020 [compost metagenome]